MANDDRQQTIDEFKESVNMTRKELEDWLQTEESQSVGQSDNGGESKGHESGRMILEILKKNKSDYTDDDIDQMRRVVSYVHRHQAQKRDRRRRRAPQRCRRTRRGGRARTRPPAPKS